MTYRTDDQTALISDFLRWLVANGYTCPDESAAAHVAEKYLRSVEPQWPAKDAENEK